MNIKLGLTYVFKDEHWFKKITRLALHQLLPISGQAILAGWSLKIAKNVVEGVDEPLPEIDFDEDKQRGFSDMEIQFVYAIPFFMVVFLLIWLSTAALNIIGSPIFNMSTLSIVQNIFFLILLYIAVLLGQVATMNYIAKGDLKAAFKLKEIWEIFKSNPCDWLLVSFISPLLQILSLLGILAFIIGIFFTMTYSSIVISHLLGQAYRNSLQKAPIPENTPE
ncbi:MAG: DUF4013 domain-containing protein [Anaerolineaceae bacterium]|nr:DUF4013 domain-containing protein [Anaerolineaceae bacterium]